MWIADYSIIPNNTFRLSRVAQLPVCLAGVQVTVTAVLQPKRGVCGQLKSQWWSRAWSTSESQLTAALDSADQAQGRETAC